MRALGVVILLVARVSVAEHHDPPAEWTVNPPAGWREDLEAQGQMVRALKQLETTREAMSRTWKFGSRGEDRLTVVWILLAPSVSTRSSVDAFDRGFIRSATRSLANQGHAPTVTELPRRDQGTMQIREATAEVDSIGTRLVRHYQAARDGLHVLILMCTESVNGRACSTPLDLATFTVKGAIELADPQSRAELAAEATGIVAGILGVLWFRRRRRRARASRQTSAP